VPCFAGFLSELESEVSPLDDDFGIRFGGGGGGGSLPDLLLLAAEFVSSESSLPGSTIFFAATVGAEIVFSELVSSESSLEGGFFDSPTSSTAAFCNEPLSSDLGPGRSFPEGRLAIDDDGAPASLRVPLPSLATRFVPSSSELSSLSSSLDAAVGFEIGAAFGFISDAAHLFWSALPSSSELLVVSEDTLEPATDGPPLVTTLAAPFAIAAARTFMVLFPFRRLVVIVAGVLARLCLLGLLLLGLLL